MSRGDRKLQIALEFIIMLTFMTVLFVFFFSTIVTQTSLVENQQAFAQLQLIAQSVAQQINIAVASGSGYYANTSVYGTLAVPSYSVNVTSGGVVVVSAVIGLQTQYATAYTNARGVISPGAFSANYLTVRNSFGTICVDYACGNITATAHGIFGSAAGTGGIYNSSVTVTNAAGQGLSGVLTGLQTTQGTFPTGNAYIVGYSGPSGVFNSFITASNTPLVVGTAFNGGNGLQANLTGWWPLNFGYGSNAVDLSGLGPTGNMIDVSWSSPQYVAQFNGQTSYGAFGTNVRPTSAITVEAWLNPSSFETYGTAVSAGRSGGYILFYPSGSNVNFYVYTTGWNVVSIPESAIPLNKFSQFVITYDQSHLSVYMNGVLQGTPLSLSGVITYDGYPLVLGGYVDVSSPPYGVSNYYNGSMANVQVYNTALTANQVYSMYRSGISGVPIGGVGNIGWWTLDGNASDYSGNGNGGTLYNIGFSSPGLPMTNPNASSFSAGAFNGVSSYITMPYSPLLNPTNSLAISAWVYPTSSGSTLATVVKKIAAVDNSYKIDTSASGATFRGYITDSNSNYCIASASSPFLTNTWYMLTYTYSTSSGGGAFYVNGELQGTCSDSNSIEMSSNTEFIGGSGYFFPGSISNVQIYNSSLTSAQVVSLYNEGPNGLPVPKNLDGWWPLHGSAADGSIFGNNGIPTNIIYSNYALTNPSVLQYSLNSTGANFNGQNSYINLGNPAPEAPGTTITVSAWIRPTSLQVGTIISRNGPFYLGFGSIWSASCTDTVGIAIYTGTWTWTCGRTKIPLNTWSQVGLVYNGISSTVYLNGVPNNVVPDSGPLTSWGGFDIGYGVPGYNQYFNGSIANVQIYKTALTPVQMSNLYAAGLLYKNIPYAVALQDVANFNGATSYVEANNPFGGGWWYFYLINNAPGAWTGSSWLTGAVAPLNTWSFVCFTYSTPSDTLTVYINGVSTASGLGTQLSGAMSACAWIYPTTVQVSDIASIVDSSSFFSIGIRNAGADVDPYKGSIANVQIYNTPLSTQEVSALYREGISGSPLTSPGTPGNVGWWLLNGNGNDYSGNANNGATSNVIYKYVVT